MRLQCIASGSSGNSIYVGDEATHLLVDCGISKKRIVEGLDSLGINLSYLHGILITHEHSDHIAGLKTILKACPTNVYATKGTLKELSRKGYLENLPEEYLHPIERDSFFTVGDLRVRAVTVSHDAAEPCAYTFEDPEKKKVGIITDLGTFDERIVEAYRNVNAILVEANHDVRMLEVGPYPYMLKQRILGNRGHMSNDTCAKFLNQILHANLKEILLGHLSKENNLEEIAYETVRLGIEFGDRGFEPSQFRIRVASRDCLSPLVEV